MIVSTTLAAVKSLPSTGQSAPANSLLQAMSPSDFAVIASAAVEVELIRGVDLVLPEQRVVDCWFPLSGTVSIIAMTSAGRQTEVGIAGREGFVDVATLHGGDRSMQRALVQIPGRALRLKASALKIAMQASPTMAALLLAYAQVFAVQLADTALACSQFKIEERLARWLLMCADRVGPIGILLTHETLAVTLGVRRAGVTVALQHLEGLGAIKTRRGGIDVVDRARLRGLTGDSYGTAEAEYHRLITMPAHRHHGAELLGAFRRLV